jgi:hypothetical protein
MVALRRAGVVLIVVVLALGLGGALAGAKKKKKRHAWGAKITLAHPSATQFTGRVNSKLRACFKGRLVTVFYTDPTGNTAHLSVQRTDAKGRYVVSLTQPAFPGTYQALAAKERIRASKAPQTCKAATSNPIFL